MNSHFSITNKSYFFKNDVSSEQRKWKGKNVSAIEIDTEILTVQNVSTAIIMERPVAVRGVVLPTKTKNRKAPPDPAAFYSLNKYIRSVTSRKRFRLVSPDSDRGHIFGLELGGPNCKYNIMPQWNGFQEHGDWRRFERSTVSKAAVLLENNNSLFLEINIEYINLNMKDLQSKFKEIFTFNDYKNMDESRVKKCLQIFGIPVSYSFDSYPCNIYIKKPRNHSLSISYIKYLYEVASNIHTDSREITVQEKLKNVQKKLNVGWGTKKSSLTNFINYDDKLFENLENFCDKGIFALSAVTEEDL